MSFDIEDYFDSQVGIAGRAGRPDDRELILAECPFCGDTKRHTYVNIDRKLFNCYKCGEVGGMTRLVAEIEGTSYSQAKAMLMRESIPKPAKPINELMERAKALSTQPGSGPTALRSREVIEVDLPAEFQSCINKKTGTISMPIYLKKRGVTMKMLRHFRIGYAGDGYYGGRIIWPVTTDGSKTFVARLATDKKEFGAGPKYINPEEAPMSHFLYNYDSIPNGVHQLILAEGVTDVMTLWSYRLNAVGLFGKALTDERIELILRLNPVEIVVMLDSDALMKAVDFGQKLSGLVEVKVAWLSSGDPGESNIDKIKATLAKSVSPESTEILRWRNEINAKLIG